MLSFRSTGHVNWCLIGHDLAENSTEIKETTSSYVYDEEKTIGSINRIVTKIYD